MRTRAEVSAGGVVIAISERANDQQATLDFWASVIQKELTKKIKGGGESLTFSDRYQRLEETAREAVKKVISD